jgi:hypothetical protein
VTISYVRSIGNVVGGSLSLSSTLIPWFVIGGTYGISVFNPSPFAWFVPWLVLLGGGLSLLSRYGAMLTSLGLVAYEASPPTLFLQTIGPYGAGVVGPGFWIAWVGIIVSLLGESLNPSVARLKLPSVFNWILPPFGAIMTLIGALTFYYGAMRGVSFLEMAPSIGVAAVGAAMVLIGLSRTSAWPATFRVWARRASR